MDYIPADTTQDAYRKQIEIIRKMLPEDRAMLASELTDRARQELIADIMEQHPEFTRQQVTREVIRRCYGEELYREIAAAKGWKE